MGCVASSTSDPNASVAFDSIQASTSKLQSGEASAPPQLAHPPAKSVFFQILFFPDKEGMPCKYGSQCRRGKACNFAHSETSLSQLLAHIRSAKTHLDVCVFNITCDEIATEILQAHARGVVVRIITDNDQRNNPGSDIQSFVDKHIPVRMDNSEQLMHHKFACIDNRLVITGSFNWTRTAVLQNKENVLITDAPLVLQKFAAEFEVLWKEFQ